MNGKSVRAAIDLGSNSCRLLVANVFTSDTGERVIRPLYSERFVSRLGEKPGRLTPKSIALTLNAAVIFLTNIREWFGDVPIFVFATSALREAENSGDLISSLNQLGLNVDILSGEREAALACSILPERGSCIDIGGGSSELMYRLRSDAEPVCMSFKAGAVRAKALFGDGKGELNAPFWEWLDDAFDGLDASIPKPVYGSGGGITSLAAYKSGGSSEGIQLTAKDARQYIEQIGVMTNSERKAAFKERADIILYSAGILAYMMERLDIGKLFATNMDNLYAYLSQTESI